MPFVKRCLEFSIGGPSCLPTLLTTPPVYPESLGWIGSFLVPGSVCNCHVDSQENESYETWNSGPGEANCFPCTQLIRFGSIRAMQVFLLKSRLRFSCKTKIRNRNHVDTFPLPQGTLGPIIPKRITCSKPYQTTIPRILWKNSLEVKLEQNQHQLAAWKYPHPFQFGG